MDISIVANIYVPFRRFLISQIGVGEGVGVGVGVGTWWWSWFLWSVNVVVEVAPFLSSFFLDSRRSVFFCFLCVSQRCCALICLAHCLPFLKLSLGVIQTFTAMWWRIIITSGKIIRRVCHFCFFLWSSACMDFYLYTLESSMEVTHSLRAIW